MPDVNVVDSIRIEVVYADLQLQIMCKVEIAANSTVGDAIRASAILDRLPADFRPAGIGIFGSTASQSTRLRDGDRVELYRPLQADPKDSRRRRARAKPKPQL
jgi:putative ubiquitin-RnfH superfamily antitoxin RatB of RatAB toxin-antitoxin module